MNNRHTLEDFPAIGKKIYQGSSQSAAVGDKVIVFPIQSTITDASVVREQNLPKQTEASPSKIFENYQYNADVVAYIAQYPFLRETLLEAYEQIRSIFGESLEKVVLKIVHDPEIPNYEHLVGYVWSDNTIEEARKMLDVFDDKWYLSLDYEKRHVFYFTIRTKK